jgi:hypothetical protein
MGRADNDVTGVPRARRPEGEPADPAPDAIDEPADPAADVDEPADPAADVDESADPAPDAVDEPRSGADAGPDALSDDERALLEFEKQWWRHAGAKEQAIRDRFDLSATRYYQLLNELLDRPAALAHDPALVKRLRRLRASRTR